MNKTGKESRAGIDRMTGLALETSARCQLACPHCFLRSCAERPSMDLMPIAVVEALLPYVSGLDSIDLTGWGEPLLNPEFFNIVKTLRNRFSGKLTVTTNGLLLSRAAMQKMIDFGLDTVCISVDAASERSYKKTRPQGDFLHLRRVLEEFTTLVDAAGRRKPLLFATFLLRREALAELADFVSLISSHGLDGVVFQQMTGVFSDQGLAQVTHCGYYNNLFSREELVQARQAARSIAPPGFVMVGPERMLDHRAGGCGSFDVSRAFVTAAGLVSACCAMAYPVSLMRRDRSLELTRPVVFGDVLKTPLPEIWRDPFYVKTREQIRAGMAPEACGDCIALYMQAGEVWTAGEP